MGYHTAIEAMPGSVYVYGCYVRKEYIMVLVGNDVNGYCRGDGWNTNGPIWKGRHTIEKCKALCLANTGCTSVDWTGTEDAFGLLANCNFYYHTKVEAVHGSSDKHGCYAKMNFLFYFYVFASMDVTFCVLFTVVL